MTKYALREVVASKTQGRDLWFSRMTGIGPMTTPDESERMLFDSKQDALRSPAMFHLIAVFEPVEVEV